MSTQTIMTPPGYGPVVVVLLIAIGLAAVIMLLSHMPGKPGRHGLVKDSIYESGMESIGDARRRFNVRFYLVAMLFLLFDVELVFMYPWARVFFQSAHTVQPTPAWAVPVVGPGALPTFLFMEMVVFLVILLVGYIYAWRKGVFRWD